MSKKFWNFENKNETTGALYLYGEISDITWWGDEITPSNFKKDLDKLGEITQLDIYINSGGGDVFAGQTINNMLKRHKAYKTVYIDGLAASIASVIAMAGDTIIMPGNSMMMIHNAWAFVAGDSEQLLEMAAALEKVNTTIVGEYVRKTGLDAEKVTELMKAETWMTAGEAFGYGFADEVREDVKIAASINGTKITIGNIKVDANDYKNLPTERFEPEEPKQNINENLVKIIKIHKRRN